MLRTVGGMIEELHRWIELVIRELVFRDRDIEEGFVRTIGPPAYRRIDFDRRALAYLRARPKKQMVRIDVPGTWRSPPSSRLSLPTANGWALAVRSEADVAEAAQAILTAVAHARGR